MTDSKHRVAGNLILLVRTFANQLGKEKIDEIIPPQLKTRAALDWIRSTPLYYPGLDAEIAEYEKTGVVGEHIELAENNFWMAVLFDLNNPMSSLLNDGAIQDEFVEFMKTLRVLPEED